MTYIIDPDFQSEYLLGPSILLRVDSRLVRGGYVYTYAPIDMDGRPIMREAFEDSFGEVIPRK